MLFFILLVYSLFFNAFRVVEGVVSVNIRCNKYSVKTNILLSDLIICSFSIIFLLISLTFFLPLFSFYRFYIFSSSIKLLFLLSFFLSFFSFSFSSSSPFVLSLHKILTFFESYFSFTALFLCTWCYENIY